MLLARSRTERVKLVYRTERVYWRTERFNVFTEQRGFTGFTGEEIGFNVFREQRGFTVFTEQIGFTGFN